ncbi:Mbov_0397 family ICE element conjugal transfer ATPase [Mycoplasmopsis agassizii]|uniref:DUF87 domain-containing protein n=1 Tax=Mycoplasmopsis agassizii TaxID=33922 RepID=A0ABX4H671_9BACT|nr:DUF87 domain-containing protein [Mycoplasmopsis agassizii]PAF55366.1 DUF87 domain-containing protein [Mycoplasmopsis agassizii]SMC20180.1 AAA-like domain-containing protein [Mycoplasmopsis agassizii]
MIIPKAFRKLKLIIWKFISLYDIIFISLFATIAVGISIPLPLDEIWQKFLVGFSIFLVQLVLIAYSKHHDAKLYVMLYRWFKYLFIIKLFDSNKKSKNASIKNLIPFQTFNEKNIVSKTILGQNKVYIMALEISGVDITNLNSEAKMVKIEALAKFFNSYSDRLTFVKQLKQYDFKSNYNFLKKQIEKSDSAWKYEWFESLYQQFQIQNAETVKEIYNIIFYGKNSYDLHMNVEAAKVELAGIGFDSKILSGNEIGALNLGLFFENSIAERLNKLEVKASHLKLNDTYVSINSVSSFPLQTNFLWLANIFAVRSNVVMQIDNVDFEQAKKKIHQASLNLQGNLNENLKTVETKEHQLYAESIEILANEIAAQKINLKKIQCFYITNAKSERELKEVEKANRKFLKTQNYILNKLVYLQLEAFKDCFFKTYDYLKFWQEISPETVAFGWPMNDSELNDQNGLLLAKTFNDEIIVFDQFKITNNRPSHNMVIMGKTGSGKSTLTKKQLAYNLAIGNKVIIIDPEREYRAMVENFGGSWVEIGMGLNTVINPLEVRVSLTDESETADNSKVIASHLEWLDSWFRVLFAEFTDGHIRLLIESVQEIYKKLNYYDESFKLDELEPNQWPIMSDLIKLIEAKINVSKKKKDTRYNLILEILAFNFQRESILSDLYNGATNINLDHDLIVFDVRNLYNGEVNPSIRASIFTILSLVQQKIVKHRQDNLSLDRDSKKWLVVCVDEAHLLLDETNPATLNFLIRTAKRIRKYFGGLVLTTQNPSDFNTSALSTGNANAIMANMQYSFFMKLESRDIDAVDQMFKHIGGLTINERRFLASAEKGAGIFSYSSTNRKTIKTNYTDLEMQHFFDKEDVTKQVVYETVLADDDKAMLVDNWLVRILVKIFARKKVNEKKS